MKLFPLKSCEQCWETFEPVRKHQKFCSEKCNDIYLCENTEKKIITICRYCKKEFIAYSANPKYCSDECRQQVAHEKYEKEKLEGTNQTPWMKLRFKILARDSFTCRYCGRKPPETILEVDHIYPRSKGGNNNEDNLITSCQFCNLGKGDTLLEQRLIEKLKDDR